MAEEAADLGVLVQMPVDVEHENGVQMKDGGLQKWVQSHTRREEVIIHAQNINYKMETHAINPKFTTATGSPRQKNHVRLSRQHCTEISVKKKMWH
jgi:hypothetical protein